MEECMRGVDVRREWSEMQMVGSFGGMMFPGTPDGMFEDWEGHLTCVQVVRVPLHPEMSTAEIAETIYNTVLTKILKSQTWMKFTHIVPRDFIIFCWLPPLLNVYVEACHERAQALVERVRNEGWPFYLKLMVPTQPGALFPAKFAFRHGGCEGRELLSQKVRRRSNISEYELSTFDPTDFDSSDGDAPDWDIFAVEENTEFEPEAASDAGLRECNILDELVDEVGKSNTASGDADCHVLDTSSNVDGDLTFQDQETPQEYSFSAAAQELNSARCASATRRKTIVCDAG